MKTNFIFILILPLFISFGCSNSEDDTTTEFTKEDPKDEEQTPDEEEITILNIPEEISSKYNTEKNTTVSDDFEDTALNTTKWFRRQALDKVNKQLTEEERFVEFKDGKLICHGMEGTGGGIVSKNHMKYGFYSLNWRVTGFILDKKSSYHPALWSARSNGTAAGRTTLNGNSWTEIDLVEVNSSSNGPVTQADAPCRIKGTKINDAAANGTLGEKAVMKSFYNDDIDGEFYTYGLEYTPEYLQVWVVRDDAWEKIGIQVDFDDREIGSVSSIPKICRSGMFWYLGNLWTGGGNDSESTTMEVDWFHYYELKS